MKLTELDVCHCTQEEVKNQMKPQKAFQKIAVSTRKQLKGRGRRGNSWYQFPGSLALSFTYRPLENITLTPLLIGVIICDYFQKTYGIELYLKWPNDLIDSDRKKVGGIIIETFNEQSLIVGVGLNLFPVDEKPKFSYETGFILKNERFETSKLLEFIYSYKVGNVVQSWSALCCHLNEEVSFESDGKESNVKFVGIGEQGEALFEDASPQFSGSIRLK